MILSAIAAMAQNRVIGINNKLPWHIPEDFKFFKQKTSGKTLIMGRKTFESLPGALPNRFHIVITRQKNYQPPAHIKIETKDFVLVESLEQAIAAAEKRAHSKDEEVFVAGGGDVYKQSLPFLNRIYLTVIQKDYEGDAYFPELDLSKFQLVQKEERPGPPPFSFLRYERK